MLLGVDTDNGQIVLDVAALQVEDVGQGVERDAQRILGECGVQKQIVASDALAAEVTALLIEVVGERRGNRRGVAAALDDEFLKLLDFLYVLLEIVVQEVKLL